MWPPPSVVMGCRAGGPPGRPQLIGSGGDAELNGSAGKNYEQMTSWGTDERQAGAAQPLIRDPCPKSRRKAASDADLQGRAVAVAGGHRLVGADPARRENPHRPGARGGEETEPAVLAQRNLGDELTAVVEQAGIAGRQRRPGPRHVALDDGLTRCAGGHGRAAGGRPAALSRAHRASPSSMGTPTSDPYSVQD